MPYTIPCDALGAADIDTAGGKAANLGELDRAGLPVPPAFVVPTHVYDEFVERSGIRQRLLDEASSASESETFDEAAAAIRALFEAAAIPADILEPVTKAYRELGHEAVAVRSSATAEDLADASFAGQQETYLNVRGAEALLAAVRSCWASLWTARAMAYRASAGIQPEDVRLAVVVQAMVEADSSGVMFTANPTNGRGDQTLIGAAWGLGESVVDGSVTTDDLVLDTASGAVRSRTIADKAVMTCYVTGGTDTRPVPDDLRTAPVLDDEAARELCRYGSRAAAHFGTPQDIEWVRSAGAFVLVQSRPITALAAPAGDTPQDWTVPDQAALYVRASIVEQLPDPLSPLFADMIDGSVSRTLAGFVNGLSGHEFIRSTDIGLPTVNGYAYYRYRKGAIARVAAAGVMGLPTLVGGKAGARDRWRHEGHPTYAAAVERWSSSRAGDLTDGELLDGVTTLLDAGTAYYATVQTVLPIAASSETMFTRFYDTFVKRAGDPPAATFLLGFDSAPIRAEKSLYDLAVRAGHDDPLAAWIRDTPGDLRHAADPPEVAARWLAAFDEHLTRHGHAVSNLDFQFPVAADDPTPLFDTVRFYLSGVGSDPGERQLGNAERRDLAAAEVAHRLGPVRRRTFRWLLRWAQGAAPDREDALADVGLAWPTIRSLLAELGSRRRDAGVMDEHDDVYWLSYDELTAAPHPRQAVIADRKARWRGQRRAVPPQLLPESRHTMWRRRFMPATEQDGGNVLRGLAASTGEITAPARVVSGPEDFAALRPGEILVAAITTPAWTTLFARAAAVVTDIGGPLSHSSIVAREYGIPAVLGTSVATRRIRSGQFVRVDGDAGTVTLPTDGPTWK